MRAVPWLAACLLLAGGCAEPAPGNVLLLVADDLGTDKVAAYGEHPRPAPTPNIDALARRGVLFRNAYSAPVCSPSRAAMLTGRYPRRYGMGARLESRRTPYELPLAETTLPELLDAGGTGYDHAAVGKWHLSSHDSPSSLRHPVLSGFGGYAGSLANLKVASTRPGRPRGYHFWEKIEDGRARFTETYATTDTVDDALDRIRAMREPWFLWVAFNAAHAPWDAPPAALHSRGSLETPADRYDAIVEALDREIARLLRGLGEETLARTTVIFVGDNGTPVSGKRPPANQRHRKGTLYEAGVRVPLVVAGPPVAQPGSESEALVHLVDVFPTVAALAGLDPEDLRDAADRPLRLDGQALQPYLADPGLPPRREFVYQDHFRPNGAGPYEIEERMLRDARYKLLVTSEGEELYDLRNDPTETRNLVPEMSPEQRRAYERLRGAMTGIVDTLDGDPARG